MGIVLKTPRAEEDIIEIWFYIAIEKGDRNNADTFLKRMDQTFFDLAKNPKIGVRKNEYANALYQFPFGRYLIFYFIINDGIEIVRVLHGARNISKQF